MDWLRRLPLLTRLPRLPTDKPETAFQTPLQLEFQMGFGTCQSDVPHRDLNSELS